MNKPKRQMNLPDRIRITTNGDCMNGIEILDLDTGKDIIHDLKNITVRDMKIDLGPRGVEAEVRFYVAKGGSMVEFVEHYGIGEVELGDFDARKSNIALKKMHVNGFAIVDDPVNPRAKIDTRHPDAKLPCPECKDKGYVDLLQGREPCKLCEGKTTAMSLTRSMADNLAKGGIVSGTVFHTKDLAGEIEEQMEPVEAAEHINCRCAPAGRFNNVGPKYGGFPPNIEVGDMIDEKDNGFYRVVGITHDAIEAEIAEEDGSGFRKDPLPTEDLVKAAVAIFDYCVLCGRNTKNANRRCDPCFEKMERQVMDLAKDQIARGLVKAGDKVRIAFDPGNVNVVATILTRPDGTLEAELDHVRKEKVQLAYRKEKSLGVLPKPAAPPAVPEAETCDECYGTGFKGGWGAPCSKGCKPKK